jgi:co-chaperonin GroES (HSP10)
MTYENALAEAFPAVEAGIQPFGSRVLIQIRTPMQKSAGGIIIDTGSRDTEKWNTQVGKVIAIGPLAFKNRDTMASWPEGAW